jgi:radial spoke head protein 9
MGIEAKNLSLDIDLLAFSGIVFSPEQRASLQTSLVILKEQYKFATIYFWGKILGVSEDYYIVQGRQKNELTDRQFLYRY